ncbi:hypothetical protein [Pseudarthrobacter siccitolerans]
MLGFLARGLLTIRAAFDFGTAWTVAAIGLSGVFTASATGLGGGPDVAGTGVIWLVSAALMAWYPAGASTGAGSS